MGSTRDEKEVVVDYGYGSDDDDDEGDFYDDEEVDDVGYLRSSTSQQQQQNSNNDRYIDREMRAADRLSVRLLAVDNNEEEENRLLRQSLRLAAVFAKDTGIDTDVDDNDDTTTNLTSLETKFLIGDSDRSRPHHHISKDGIKARKRVWMMIASAITGLMLIVAGMILVGQVTGPPYQPVGPYTLIECQTGIEFFNYYNFYDGSDSVGSNGYNQYVNQEHAITRGILNVTQEVDDMYTDNETRSFIYMGSAPTNDGPRDSIRLEGTRRFNRGLFIIDIRHMPAGCGVWPAFWLTDEENWPVHGEIDIVEGVNYQSVAKTALHSTKGCSMYDIPLGTMTGGWDTAQGIPDSKTGIPDMKVRYAQNCFVYDPHQWLNQGCVAVDTAGESLGQPLNAKGGGVYALEWDPINRHIRSWVFSPHSTVPDNLRETIRTATLPSDERIMPNTELWPIPYGFFAIGEGTDCPTSHFRQMRLVFNTAFCGSVAGNRFHLDCPKQALNFSTCNDWIQSDPDEMNESYWKIGGVFVYEREWENSPKIQS